MTEEQFNALLDAITGQNEIMTTQTQTVCEWLGWIHTGQCVIIGFILWQIACYGLHKTNLFH